MESFSLDNSCAETDLVERTWTKSLECDYGPADQNPRGTISEILVRSRPPRTKITGVGPKSLVILVQRTKIPAEQYRRFWSARTEIARTKIPVTGLWLVSLVNQTVFRERACASERGEGKEKYGLAKLARFSRPRQDFVVTNQIADPA